MRVFDASSIIHAWDSYPLKTFPPMWEWMESCVRKQEVVFSAVALEEVKNKFPEIATWLKKRDVEVLQVTQQVATIALSIKNLLGVQGEQYGGGVGENDILIIATAKAHQVELVTDESIQLNLPTKMKNYKIPAVCSLRPVGVKCMSFLDVLKKSNEVFG